MDERFCADALIKYGPYDSDYEAIDHDKDEYRQFCAATREQAIKLAESASIVGEAVLQERQIDHPVYGWIHEDFLGDE